MVDRQDRGQAQFDAIVRAALHEFELYGFEGTRLQNIADLAGISKANLLYYFPSKVVLYRHVLEIAIQNWADIFTIDPNDDPQDALRHYIHAKIDFSAQHPHSARIFTNEVLAGLPHIKDHVETNSKLWLDKHIAVIEAWQDAGKVKTINAHHVMMAIWGMTQHLADYQHQLEAIKGGPLTQQDYEAYKESFTNIILGALIPQ